MADGYRGCFWVCKRICGQEAQIFLGGENGARFLICTGGNDNLGEDLCDFLCSRTIKRLVEGDNPPKGRCAVAVKGPQIGLGQACAAGNATGIGMFDNRTGRAAIGQELADQFKGCVCVVDVIVGQLFALVLFRGGNARAACSIGIKGRRLMWVFAVTQRLHQAPCHSTAARCGIPQSICHPS